MTAPGLLNAICFWFDLHMDDVETLTNAPPGVGKGGVLLRPPSSRRAARRAAKASEPGSDEASVRTVGLGGGLAPVVEQEEESAAEEVLLAAQVEGVDPAKPGLPEQEPGGKAEQQEAAAAGASLALVAGGREGPEASAEPEVERHHWGQALQYLERTMAVRPGERKVVLLCKLQKGRLEFSLREGVGQWAAKAPWKVSWGGGASIESPHFQRVHYCELLVREFLMRVKCKRFPPIERDMKMILAHSGNLFLDLGCLSEVPTPCPCPIQAPKPANELRATAIKRSLLVAEARDRAGLRAAAEGCDSGGGSLQGRAVRWPMGLNAGVSRTGGAGGAAPQRPDKHRRIRGGRL